MRPERLAPIAGMVFLLGGTAQAATLTVNHTDDPGTPDDGLCSLREAVAAMNAGAGDAGDCLNTVADGFSVNDSIVFDTALDGVPLLLDGQLVVEVSLTITGNGAAETVLDAQETARFFHVTVGDLNLQGLTLQNARSGGGGGAIRYEPAGTLTIENSVLDNNATVGSDLPGGAIFTNSGKVIIRNSTLSNNFTLGDRSVGGAIRTSGGDVEIENSALSTNSTNGINAHGGAVRTATGDVTVLNSALAGNSTKGGFSIGGAIYSSSGGKITILNSSLGNNSSNGTGGAVRTEGDGDITIIGSSLSGNSALDGAGGAVHLGDGDLTIVNSTLSDNSSTGLGGAIFKNSQEAIIINSSLLRNQAEDQGGGIYQDSASGTFRVHNSIIAQNTDGGDAPDIHIPAELIISHSLIGDNTGTSLAEAPLGSPDANGNLIGDPDGSGIINPQLAPLADNGGPTRTHALCTDVGVPHADCTTASPALDAGDNALAVDPDMMPLEFDQRGTGFPRIDNGTVDMGAYEFQTLPSVMFNDVLSPVIPEDAGMFSIPDAILLSKPFHADVMVSLEVDAASAAGSPDDFTVPTPLTIPAGETAIDLDVTIVDDSDVEGDETALVNLTDPVNATLGDPAQGEAVIVDNDFAPEGGSGDDNGSDGGGSGGGSNHEWYEIDVPGCVMGRPGISLDPLLPLLILLAMGWLARRHVESPVAGKEETANQG